MQEEKPPIFLIHNSCFFHRLLLFVIYLSPTNPEYPLARYLGNALYRFNKEFFDSFTVVGWYVIWCFTILGQDEKLTKIGFQNLGHALYGHSLMYLIFRSLKIFCY
jgi:hypothetical protein